MIKKKKKTIVLIRQQMLMSHRMNIAIWGKP